MGPSLVSTNRPLAEVTYVVRLGPQNATCHGLLTQLPESQKHIPQEPIAAKDRLVAHGVRWIFWDGEPDVLTSDTLTYYVVMLTYEAKSTV